jgi:nucleotide-binding universal stress UspA family protein
VQQKTRLLIAVSSPWVAQRLAGPLSDLASQLGAEAVVAHVSQNKEEDEHESDAQQRGEGAIQIVVEALSAADVSAESVLLLADDVARAILNTAKSQRCQMIVLGLTRPGGFWAGRWFGSSVQRAVLKHTTMPVLLWPLEETFPEE